MTSLGKTFSFCVVLMIAWNPELIQATNAGRILPQVLEHIQLTTVGILQHSESEVEVPNNVTVAIRGTGIHIGDGYIVTAKHAVTILQGRSEEPPQTIQVLTSRLNELSAEFIGINHFVDMAIYRIHSETDWQTMPHASFSESPIQSGEEVFTIGYPLGWGPAYAFGRVGNSNTFLPTAQTRLIQIDMAICQGNSGGGLFNTHGEIVGMIQAIIQTDTQLNDRRCSRFAFSVPGQFTKKISTALIQGENPQFSRLGITMTSKKVGRTRHIAVAKSRGPARKAGLRKGDIILAVEEKEISTAAQLKNFLIEHTQPGQQITIRVLRGHTEKTHIVTLGKS